MLVFSDKCPIAFLLPNTIIESQTDAHEQIKMMKDQTERQAGRQTHADATAC